MKINCVGMMPHCVDTFHTTLNFKINYNDTPVIKYPKNRIRLNFELKSLSLGFKNLYSPWSYFSEIFLFLF